MDTWIEVELLVEVPDLVAAALLRSGLAFVVLQPLAHLGPMLSFKKYFCRKILRKIGDFIQTKAK
jgi:hypothetical protein